jgi:hypothetical protein
MIVLNSQVQDFFNEKIFDLDDEEVDDFLGEFNREIVIQCLFEKLKSISMSEDDIEPAWRLGGIFGYISKRYDVDLEAYSWFNAVDMIQKKSFLNFMSGYWNRAKPDPKVLASLSDIIEKELSSNSKWSQELIFWGIEAVSTGYCSFKNRSEIDAAMEKRLNKKLNLFASCLSNFSDSFLDVTQTLKFVRSLIT